MSDLNEKEMAVLEAIKQKIDAQIEQKASKADVEKLTKAVADSVNALSEFKGQVNFDLMQKQLDKLFERTDAINRPVIKAGSGSPEERKANQLWLRAFLKRDKAKMIEITKEITYSPYFEPSLHTGATDYPAATSTQGEYLIPELLLAEINRFVYEAGVARREMRYLPFSGPGNERIIPALTTSVTVAWVEEGGVKPKTKPLIDRVIQKLYKLAAITVMTEEIIEDSAIDLIALTSELIGEAIAIEEDRTFLAGDIGAGDVVDGVLYATGTVAATLGVGVTAAQVTPDDLNAMIYDVPTPARRGAKFFMNPGVFANLQTYRADAVAAADGAGPYLVQSPVNGGPATLWGYPIVLTDELPAPADVGWEEPFMFFGNLNKTCVYGDKQGLRVKMLDQASITNAQGDLVNLAESDLLALRVHKRVGYVPVLPGGICVLSTNTAS